MPIFCYVITSVENATSGQENAKLERWMICPRSLKNFELLDLSNS